jgi:4-hydroxy-2-oxoheptanedioate aldolase
VAKSVDLGRERSSDPNALGRRFKELLQSGKVILGGTISNMIRPPIVKLYRHAGFEFIFTDNEHVLMAGQPEMGDFVLTARDSQMPVIAKTPVLSRTDVARLLEAGVIGIQLPRTESRQDIETLRDFMLFPPHGTRAGAPIYGNVDYIVPSDGQSWIKQADEALVIVAHIETKRGYENAEEIITTPGVDMVYVGPYDFSISVGHAGDYDHPDVIGPMDEILDLCVKHNVPFGTTTTSAKMAGRWIGRGARFFEVIDEMSLIVKGAVQIVDAYRAAEKDNAKA